MMSIDEIKEAVASEITESLRRVSPDSLDAAIKEITKARRVFLAGAGRSSLGIRGFAMRLMHMGIKSYVVGETTTPGINAEDLLIIGSGSGRTESLLAMAKKAKNIGAKLLLITLSPNSPIGQLADSAVKVIAPSPKAAEQDLEIASIQPMGSLFEQSLFLLCDCVVLSLMQAKSLTSDEMFTNHANLE